ncbi:MAG: response regulator [Elusimicrobia bacterium]|jgi:excisionase family DNA binding protein|nr:response regulator [Elusimicrobiota bacterium]
MVSKMKKVYTTRQVGNFCGVDLTTVINWVKQGKINAYKTAGGHRRIPRQDLRNFMEEYSMPIPDEIRETEGLKILVVDDDPNILTLISNAMKRSPKDYKLATAADGFEAGSKLERFKPNLVILDIRLPGIDGYSIIKKIRKEDKGKKILAITAYGDNETKDKILAAGADGYLAKPFSIDEFIGTVLDMSKNI